MSLESLDRAMEGTVDLSVGDIVAKYGNKQAIAMAVQKGEIPDVTKAVMAGMAIDRITASAMQPPTTTVAQDVFAQPQMQGGIGAIAPQGMEQNLAAAQQMQGQPAGAGLDQIPVPEQMFNQPQGMAGGGIVAFQSAGFVADRRLLAMMNGQERAEYQMTGKIPERLQPRMEGSDARFARQGTGVPMSSAGLAAQGFTPTAAPRAASNLPSTAQTAAQQAAVPSPEQTIEDMVRQDLEMRNRILGEDPTRAKLKALYEKQEKSAEEDSRKDQAMRLIEAGLGIAGGTSPYFAANLAGAAPAIKGYGEDVRARRKEATERAKGMAELEGLERKEKAEVLTQTMAQRREDKKIKEEREFKEKVANRELASREKIAGMRDNRSASEYIGELLKSKDPVDREVGRQLLGSSKSGEMTTSKAIELAIQGNPTLGMPGKEKELEAAVQRLMNLQNTRTFSGFSSRQL